MMCNLYSPHNYHNMLTFRGLSQSPRIFIKKLIFVQNNAILSLGDIMRELIISENEGGQRLDKYLSKRFKTMPQSLIYKYLRTKKIKLNGKKALPNGFICCGDVLTLYIPEEFFEEKAEELAFTHVKPKLSVIYEDENILLVDKPIGMLCHSDDNEGYNTLINHIKAYLSEKGEYDVSEAFAPALCNRIDRNTCGIVIAAKTAEALRDMNERIRNRSVTKQYLAAVHGSPSPAVGTITDYIRKDSSQNRVYLSKDKRSSMDKSAVTKYKVIETKGDVSLVEVELIMGRTHQIRAHFAGKGHPLLGDGKYAINKKDRQLGYSYQSLCAYRLKFNKAEPDSLSYLDGKTFYSSTPDFLKLFKYRF